MKIVVNGAFGGFGLSEWAESFFEKDELEGIYSGDSSDRRSETLVDLVENYPSKINDDISNLVIVEVPDDSTDVKIMDYDGSEVVLYVKDGRIHTA